MPRKKPTPLFQRFGGWIDLGMFHRVHEPKDENLLGWVERITVGPAEEVFKALKIRRK